MSVRICSVGTANPPDRYTQGQVLELFGVTDRRITGLFKNAHIQSRALMLPKPLGPGGMPDETPEELNQKHLKHAVSIGKSAIQSALQPLSLTPKDVDYFLCVSSTGFLCPGLTARLIKELGFREDVQRADVVGMGCNGGLNGLQPVANFCAGRPDTVGLLLCVEICSAAYVFDGTVETSVVNSLFGDGAAAAVLTAAPEGRAAAEGPRILGFGSHIMTDAIDAMRFDLKGTKFSFFLDRDIPYVIGANASKPVDRLLSRFELGRKHISHWIIHSGGRKVIDAIKYALNITSHDVRHTETVLRDHGNLSSASFLFSYQRLIREGVAAAGDYIMMMTMGPGSTIETCLGQF